MTMHREPGSARALCAAAVCLMAVCFVEHATVAAMAEETTEAGRLIRAKVEQTMTILRDTGLQTEAALPELRSRLIETIEPMFTFREMTVRALGPHARGLDPAQIDTLTPHFQRLLERVYIDRLTANLVKGESSFSVEDIRITGEETRGNYSKVFSKAIILKNAARAELSLNYRMAKRDGAWYVYDMEIEGVSLIENYRTQFNEVLTSKSFSELVRMVSQNVADLDKQKDAADGGKGVKDKTATRQKKAHDGEKK